MSETRVLADESGATAESASQKYVEEMGQGWNLGNTFDGFTENYDVEDEGETAWGNPTVTKDLIKSVKAKGYSTIRMPLTLHRRYTVNESAKDDEIKYVIDGTYTNDDSIVKLEGWPASMTFDTKAHEEFTQAGVRVDCYDTEKYISINLGIKDAPVVSDVNVKADESTAVTVSNIVEDAVVTYSVDDDTIAAVDDKGNVKGLKEGSTVITATVTQYGRTDSFKANVTVAKADVKSDDNKGDKDNKDNNKDNGSNGNAAADKNDNGVNSNKNANNSNNNTAANTAKTAPTAKSSTNQTATKTGDSNKAAAWFMIMMAGAGVAAFGKKRILSK